MKDWKTKNKSFIKIAEELRDKHNVKNYDFMLELYDKTLVGVDPYSDNLTDFQKAKIYIECTSNKWYFIREVVRIPVSGNNIPYILNLGNLALTYMKQMNVNQITILPRQSGKTIGNIVDDVWVFYFGSTNTQMSYLNKSFTDSMENVKRFKTIRDLLPKYLLDIVMSSKDRDAQIKKTAENFNNSIVAKSSPTNMHTAENLGRGTTTSIVYIDELAFLKFNDTVYAALGPAWQQAAIEAEKSGVPYSITITTTPNNRDIDSGRFCLNKIVNKATPIRWEMYDMSRDELKKFVDDNSSVGFVHIQYTWRELGRDDEWYRKACKTLLNNKLKIAREIDLEWTQSSDDAVFTEEQLRIIKQFVVEKPVASLPLLDGRYYLDFYKMPNMLEKYIVTCDVAGGLFQDNSALNIIDPSTFEIIGDFRNNKIDTDDYKNVIKEIVNKYFPKSVLIIERNSYGLNIIQSLEKIASIEKRMYGEDATVKGEKTLLNGSVIRKKRRKYKYGVDTTSKSRKMMFDLLPRLVDEEPHIFKSPHIYSDLRNLIQDSRGRIDHRKGTHDDSLMSYLLFRYALHAGKTLSTKFMINKIPSTSNSSVKGNQLDDIYLGNVLRTISAFNDGDDSSNQSSLHEVMRRKDEIDKYRQFNEDIKRPDDFVERETTFDKILKLNKEE
jgi:hypothetical protein